MPEPPCVMLGGYTMLTEKKKESQTTWSIDMLEDFKEFLVYSRSPELHFIINEGDYWITYTNMAEERYSSFIGELFGFEDVYCALSSSETLGEEYRDYMGYIEISNGKSNEGADVPMINGCIKKDIGFFESVSKLAIESRMINSNTLITLGIRVDLSGLKKNTPTENLLNMKLPIKSIQICNRISLYQGVV
jgi:hypothetical protein